MLADGHYRIGHEFAPDSKAVWYVFNGKFSGLSVAEWQELGYTFTPLVLLTVEEHAELVRSEVGHEDHTTLSA